MISPQAAQGLGVPQPGGCPAIHLYLQGQEAFAIASKIPITALGKILKIVNGNHVSSTAEEDLDRIRSISMWAILGDDDYLTDPDDRAALLAQPVAGPVGSTAPHLDPGP